MTIHRTENQMKLDTIKKVGRPLLFAVLLLAMYAGSAPAADSGAPGEATVVVVQDGFHVGKPHPNPFSRTTALSYTLPEPGLVRIVLFDALGRPVRRLVDERQAAGRHRVEVNGEGLASGLYLIEVRVGGRTETRRATLVR